MMQQKHKQTNKQNKQTQQKHKQTNKLTSRHIDKQTNKLTENKRTKQTFVSKVGGGRNSQTPIALIIFVNEIDQQKH